MEDLVGCGEEHCAIEYCHQRSEEGSNNGGIGLASGYDVVDVEEVGLAEGVRGQGEAGGGQAKIGSSRDHDPTEGDQKKSHGHRDSGQCDSR